MIGDFVNLALTIVCVQLLFGPPRLQAFAILFYLPIGAELVWLLAERIPLTFSLVWQLLPHRHWAQRLLDTRQIAARYTYSVKYVEEVLMLKMSDHHS